MSDTPSPNSTWTVGKLLTWTTRHFQEKEIEGGRLAAELLLAHALGCRKIELYTRYETEPSAQQREAFRGLVKRAAGHAPIAYLLGFREFFSLTYKVTPDVLIPRPETEVLVQRAIDICRSEPSRIRHVLDVGTGSGCIAVTIAKLAPNARVVATDVSPEALAVARENVASHDVADRVTCVQADGVVLPGDMIPEGDFDILVSNPPYISDAHWRNLPPHIRAHEPETALRGPGGDGLAM
jgi:release factor glutamine methyltransferase